MIRLIKPFFILLVLLITPLFKDLQAEPSRNLPQAEKGILDLRNWDFERDGGRSDSGAD
jgi:hypothetical protein